MNLPDTIFLEEFENQTLPPEAFNHRGHLRLAWLYLQHDDFPAALKKISTGIKKYAASLGATDKYHHTLTVAFVAIINQRIRHGDRSCRQFR